MAEFAIPAFSIVAERSPTFIVCTSMRTIPSSATLATEVVLSLSTVDGTGRKKKDSTNLSS